MFKISREEGESWRECVERIAKQAGLEVECLEEFDTRVAAGDGQSEAAFCALYEWDCCPLDPEAMGKLEIKGAPETADTEPPPADGGKVA